MPPHPPQPDDPPGQPVSVGQPGSAGPRDPVGPVGPEPMGLPRDVTPDPPPDHVPPALRIAAALAWRAIVVVVALWGLVLGLAATSHVVIPVAVGVLLTALTFPVATALRRLGLPRRAAAAATVLSGLALVVGLMGVAGTQVVRGLSDLRDSAAQGLTQVLQWLETGPLGLDGGQVGGLADQARRWVGDNGGRLTSGALEIGQTAGSFLAGAVIALIAAFFFLAEGEQIWRWHVRLLPRHVQDRAHQAFRRGWVTLGSYVRTQVLVAFIDAVGIALGALVLGLPLVVPLGVIVFFASAVPIVGAVVSGALAVLVALVVKGPLVALIMLAIVLGVQQVEGNVLHPVLMSRAVALHPLATLLGVTVGAFLMGIVGALFAVPVIALTNTVILYLTGHDPFPELAGATTDDPGSGGVVPVGSPSS